MSVPAIPEGRRGGAGGACFHCDAGVHRGRATYRTLFFTGCLHVKRRWLFSWERSRVFWVTRGLGRTWGRERPCPQPIPPVPQSIPLSALLFWERSHPCGHPPRRDTLHGGRRAPRTIPTPPGFHASVGGPASRHSRPSGTTPNHEEKQEVASPFLTMSHPVRSSITATWFSRTSREVSSRRKSWSRSVMRACTRATFSPRCAPRSPGRSGPPRGSGNLTSSHHDCTRCLRVSWVLTSPHDAWERSRKACAKQASVFRKTTGRAPARPRATSRRSQRRTRLSPPTPALRPRRLPSESSAPTPSSGARGPRRGTENLSEEDT